MIVVILSLLKKRGDYLLTILYKSGVLMAIIFLGYLLKKGGLFSKERDFRTISDIILYITLPAALINNLNGLRFPLKLLLLSIIGFMCNWLYILLSNKFGKDKEEKSFMMLNVNGYNIGNFSLPFISFFLEGIPILAISLFDAGSSIMVLGGNYAIAESAQQGESKIQFKALLKKVIQSPSVIVYILMVILSLASINLPVIVMDLVGIVGGANTFLAMFMIGIALELNFERENIALLLKFTLIRYLPAILLGIIITSLSFIPLTIKYALTLVFLAPASGSAAIFTERMNGDVELSAQFNSLSIILSIILMSAYLIYLGV